MRLGQRWSFAWALLAVLGMAACSKSDLAFRPAKGDSKTYRAEMKVETVMNFDTPVEGMKMEMDEEESVVADLVFEVQDVQPTETVVKVTYGDLQTASKGALGGEAFDTGGDAAAMRAKVEGLLEGKSFTAKIGPKGSINEVSGLDELSEEVKKTVQEEIGKAMGASAAAMGQLPPSFMNDLSDAAVMQAAGGLADRDQVRQWLENIFAYFPPEEAKTGYTWSDKDKVPGVMPMVVDRKYTLASVAGDAAEVKFTSEVSSNPAEKARVPMFGDVALSGRGEGTAKLSRNGGWPVQVNEDLNMSGQMKMDMPVPTPQPIDIRMKLNIKSHMTITQKP